jgi:hypothetical protein
MSKLQVDDIVNKNDTGSVGFSRGAVVTGIVTATGGSFSGNVSIGGTLTYEDVTNIDSVGLITARKGANSSGPFSWNTGALTTFDPPAGAGSDTATDVAIALGGGHRIVGYIDGYIRSLLEWNPSDNIIIGQSSTGLISGIEFKPGSSGSVKSYYNTDIKFQTTAYGTSTAGAVAGYDYLQAPFSTTVNFAVAVASKTAAHRYNGTGSGSGYVIDGVQSPFLTLTPGRTYRFTLSSSDMTSHPFRFYLEADKTTAYTTNVTSTSTYTEIVVTDSTPQVLHYQCSAHAYMGNAVNTNSNAVVSTSAAIFKSGLAEKYESAGTTLGSQPNNPLSDGNVILFTGNESGNKTINFTGVHATLSNGETVSFTAIITPNGSGVINVVQVDGQSPAGGLKWSGGSAPSAGASGQDIYTFQILKTGSANTAYTVFGAATNYA